MLIVWVCVAGRLNVSGGAVGLEPRVLPASLLLLDTEARAEEALERMMRRKEYAGYSLLTSFLMFVTGIALTTLGPVLSLSAKEVTVLERSQ